MANDRRRVVLVISAAMICSVLLVWVILHPQALGILRQQRALWTVLACLCVVPLFFYPRIAKRHPGYGLGLALMAAALVLISLGGVTFFAFNIDNAWTNGLRYTSQLLVLVATVVFIRQAVTKSRDKEHGTSKTER